MSKAKDTRKVASVAAGENEVGTLASTTTPSEIGFFGLLRDRSRRSWTVPNVSKPRQIQNDERKLDKK
ncbi:hypothetical protein CDL15_Pgr002691 [Punica granatum]|uniref:Uncharacterized protein n=1 Tax=Punica granatum TaxID=22663 RepID=A0A218XQ64_PUNGR|nr:hypothetical protein CDL15_Pgr002691 [Punica granatum]